jgi:nitronate monooxygenase
LFCHQPAARDAAIEAAWTRRLAPLFAQYGAQPPTELWEIYTSFVEDRDMAEMIVAERPAVVSFHFGLPDKRMIQALQKQGVVLLATATNVDEAKAIHAAGIDAIVAQGFEAGGHRGNFDPQVADERLSMATLTRLIASTLPIPVIAAGGIMDGAGIAAALALGASAAQLGTAFVLCSESSIDAGYRKALSNSAEVRTMMTSAISGRPARSLVNRFTELGCSVDASQIPAYPVTYDAGKSLHAAAKKSGEFGYGAQWAGEAAALARAMPAAELVASLERELDESLARLAGSSKTSKSRP